MRLNLWIYPLAAEHTVRATKGDPTRVLSTDPRQAVEAVYDQSIRLKFSAKDLLFPETQDKALKAARQDRADRKVTKGPTDQPRLSFTRFIFARAPLGHIHTTANHYPPLTFSKSLRNNPHH